LPPNARGVLPAPPRYPGHVRVTTIAAKVRHRTVVHMGGSTLRRMNRRRRDEAALHRAGLVASHAVGVSVGPFRNTRDELEIREFLKRFRSISLRDVASYERTRSLGLDVPVCLSFDPAVLLPDFLPSTSGDPRGRPRLGVALRLFESQEGDTPPAIEGRRLHSVTQMLKRLAETVDYEVVVFAFNGHPERGDVELANRLATAVGGAVPATVVRYDGDLRSIFSEVSRCDAVVAMRLHAAVFAYTAQVPFALIDYHPKCAEFARSVDLSRDLVFAGDGSDLDDSTQLVASLLGGGRRPSLSVGEARSLALGAFDLLKTCVSG
jgi:polysaccharide pyruvyl transferase WcaK-like protein